MKQFGRGRGRSGRFPFQDTNEKRYALRKVKTEKLQDSGHLVSPESKKIKTFPIMEVLKILKGLEDLSTYQDDELKAILKTWRIYKHKPTLNIQTMSVQAIKTELQTIQTQLIAQDYDFSIDEVVAILKVKEGREIEEMDTEEIREMLSVWKKHNKEDNSVVKTMNHSDISNALGNIKATIIGKGFETGKDESMTEQFDPETDHIFATVDQMNVDENTTKTQILQFNDKQLVYFQYVHSLRMDEVPDIDDLKESERTNLVQFCLDWIKRQKQMKENKEEILNALLSEDETSLDDLTNVNPTTTECNTDNDVVMTDKEDETSTSSNNSLMSIDANTMSDLKNITNIKAFSDLTNEQKCEWICNESNKKGEKIHLESINLWSEQQLIQTAQSLLKPAVSDDNKNKTKSNLKKTSKYTSKILTQTDMHANKMKEWRYSLFLTSPQEKKGTEGLINYLGDIFHEMGSFCTGIQLLLWDSEDMEEGIEDSEDIPRTITKLKKYFKGARAPTGASKQYLKIRLGFPITSDRPTFEADMIGWCKDRDIRMYECALQHPNSKIIGWLSYIPNTVDRQKWCIATQELYRVVDKSGRATDIKLGLVWKALNGQWEVPQRDKVYAFHVEAAMDQATLIKKFLRLVAHNKKFPLGVRFKLVDEYNQYMKDTSKVKYKYMFDKHKTLQKEMRQMETSAILNLDRKIGSTKFTLRDVVNNIRDKTDNRRVFNSIDQKYNNPAVYVVQYRPDKGDLAKAHISSLVTYVRHLYPEASLSKIFTIDAIDESEVEKYYPNTQTFLTQEDIDFDAVIQEDLDDDSFEYLNVNNINPFEIQLPEKLKGGEKLYNLNGDEDTASTMPAQSSTISFTNASVHLYDTKSLVSEISSMSDNKRNPNKSAESKVPQTMKSKMDEARRA